MPTVRIHRFEGDRRQEIDDILVEEEPLEIRVGERPVSVTLRTPGDDFDLAAGFLAGESILRSGGQITNIRHWGSSNLVRVDVAEEVRPDLERLQRSFYSTSSCGVCGKTSIDAIRVHASPLEPRIRIRGAVIAALPDALRAGQTLFESTGAIHAAGIFTVDGDPLRLREDVGRHNAVDKVIGSFFREGIPLEERILVVSGRTSFEVLQKAIVARIPVVAAVGAPSSLAVDLARTFGVTLIGFVRGSRFNVYTGEAVVH